MPGSDGVTGEYHPTPVEVEVPRLRGTGLAGVDAAPLMDHHEHLMAVRAGDLASVHSWELVTAVDGPGTRLTLFLAGCPLRCLYCHNPDTFKMPNGEPVLLADVIARLTRYLPIFKATHGGLTISGGEPLMQTSFVTRLLHEAHSRGVHTAIDTSGFLGANLKDEHLKDLDLVLLDVKSGDPVTYRKVTGRQLEPTLKFGDRLAHAGIEVWIRFVLVPGLTDDPDNVNRVADIVSRWPNVSRVEVLPFHQMGADKWQTLGLKYELEGVEPPSKDLVATTKDIFASRGLTVY